MYLWLCDLVFLLLLVFFCFTGAARVLPHGPFLGNKEIRRLHLSISDPKSFHSSFPCYKTAANICRACSMRKGYDNPGQSFILAGFVLSLPRPDQAPGPTKETGCDPAQPAQLCWSSGISFPCICNTTSWYWTVRKLIQLLRGIDSITFRFLQCLGVLALICFSCWNTNYRKIKSTELTCIFLNSNAYESGYKGRSYPDPVATGAREHESTHTKPFCNETQNH